MDILQAIALAIVQGLSEFLPISSSGHLILMPWLFGWADQGLAFDVAVHVGTLVAVVAYFRRELWAMARAWLATLGGAEPGVESRLAWCVILGTIPVGVAGLLFGGLVESALRDPRFVAGTLALFGILMWAADAFAPSRRDETSIGWRDALLIGLAQALALMPGTSRSGITMTVGRCLGLSRVAAARFSFLLAVPGIAMAGGWEFSKLLSAQAPVDWWPIAVGIAVSALTGYACIHYFLRAITRIGLLPFAAYRLLIAGAILYVFW